MNERMVEIRKNLISKFIMTEFVNGNLNSQNAVNEILKLIQSKLNMSTEQAASFLRNQIGINNIA